jgi:Asp-tRNA(Asn)/Glu-tRNA(Gln) amidotransferase B subunit
MVQEHMDQLGEITKQLRDALTEMLVKKEAFKNACIEAEGYMIKEREALRQRYEAALANQRKSVDKYQRDATDKEARLKEVCVKSTHPPLHHTCPSPPLF